MVGMKPREKEERVPTTEKSKTFGTVSAITTEAKQDDEQIKCGATTNHEKTTSLELGDLIAKLQQIGKKLKWSEEDQQMLKKEIRYNKNENLDNCFNLARATEEWLQQMSDKARMDTMSRDRAESSCAIQSKLDALLRNSTAQDKLFSRLTAKTSEINGINGSLHRYRGLQRAQGQGGPRPS